MKKKITLLIALATLCALAACGTRGGDRDLAGFDPAVMFEATVIEAHDDYLIVEPFETYSESKSADRIRVSTADLSLEDAIKPGDTVAVYYEGGIQETYPAVAAKVVRVKVVEGQEDTQIAPAVTNASVAWANWSDDPAIHELALNRDRFVVSIERHIPVYKCGDLEELDAFRAAFSGIFSLSGSYDEVPSFEETVSTFGEAFFAEHDLVLVYVEANSGSLRFDVEEVAVDGDTFCAYVVQTNHPEEVTDDMAGWLMVIPVRKEAIQDVVHFDAVLR